MGTDFALACGDCLEFIGTHKWSIIEEAGKSLVATHAASWHSCQQNQFETVPALSDRPIVSVTDLEIAEALKDFVPHQPYIDRLTPIVRDFLASHKSHFLFLICDISDLPWYFGEPQWFKWKEIQAECSYHGQFLPRNLIQDFGFLQWQEVLDYYAQHQAWFLHEQMKEDREALRQAFERESLLFLQQQT